MIYISPGPLHRDADPVGAPQDAPGGSQLGVQHDHSQTRRQGGEPQGRTLL